MRPQNDRTFTKLKGIFHEYPQIVFDCLFGSHAAGEQTPLNDIDIAVYVKKGLTFSFGHKLDIHGKCCRLLRRDDIDIVVLNQTRNLRLNTWRLFPARASIPT